MNDASNNTGKVQILHLYHDLMNLYGDRANVSLLARELAARGVQAMIDCISVGDEADFEKYDFIYIGSGTERSQKACMRDLTRHKKTLVKQIEAGAYVLSTGNSHELFGRSITGAGGDRYDTLGLLDFETVQQHSRVTGDCVFRVAETHPFAAYLPHRMVGFINRAGHGQEGDIERPFIVEPGPGANDKAGAEGIVYKNLLGTYITGPILVRNPPLLRFLADRLCPDTVDKHIDEDPVFAYQEAAYQSALRELSALFRRSPR